MSRLFVLVVSLVLVVALAPLGQIGADDKKSKNHIVEMHDDYFKPKEIKIKVGDTITWVNKGDHPHNAYHKGKDKALSVDSKTVKEGKESKPMKFTKAGKIPYVCTFHEDKGMKGTIIVE
jgi:plastocyanin